jgi:AraC-like DNA-binding protein
METGQAILIDDDWFIEHVRGDALIGMAEEHSHNCYEIYLYLGKEMIQFIEDRNYTLRSHDMVLIDRRVYHKTRYPADDQSRERILIMFAHSALRMVDSQQFAEQLARLFSLHKVQFHSNEALHAIEEDIIRLERTFSGANSVLAFQKARLQLCELLVTLVDLHERGVLTSDADKLNTAEKRVSAVVRYINERYSASQSLDELARLFFVSRYTLCHEFKKITGTTVVEFINRKRLAEASRLLRGTSSSVTDVAQAVGFNSINNFNVKFRQAHGCTPSEYRRGSSSV